VVLPPTLQYVSYLWVLNTVTLCDASACQGRN
jgi:hypothetical protein